MNAPLPGPLNDNPSSRPLGGLSIGRQSDRAHRPGRARPGRSYRDGADCRRRARRRDGAASPSAPATRKKRRTKAIPPAVNRSSSAAWRWARRWPKFARCFSIRPRKYLPARSSELSVRDGNIYRNGKSTGQDYWTLAGAVDLAIKATGAAARKPVSDLKTIGANSARLDLPAKVFGDSVFIHDMRIDGMVHARVVRQPNRGATIGSVDENAIRRAAKGPVEFVRNGNFLAILGDNETRRGGGGRCRGEQCDLAERRSPDTDTAGGQLAVAAAGRRSALRGGTGRRQRPGALRKNLYARISRARFDLALVRPGALQGRTIDGVDALPGRLSAARGPGEDAEARAILDRRSSCAGLRLLRPQWRGRRRRRRRHHRHAEAGPADPRALAARRRIHLRAEDAGDDRQGSRTARRGRQAHPTGRRKSGAPRTISVPARAEICSAPSPCPIRRRNRRRTMCRRPMAAARPAMASRSMTFPPSACSIIW